MAEALRAYAGWLPEEWEEKWSRSKSFSAPKEPPEELDTGPGGRQPWPVELDELERAVLAVRGDPEARKLFEEGFKVLNGNVDHSQTEFRLALFLKEHGFSKEACWAVVRLCPHTKSIADRRGRRYFEIHVWGRLEADREDGTGPS
jgi:hypothetical protein